MDVTFDEFWVKLGGWTSPIVSLGWINQAFQYNQLEKMVKDFANLTMAPLWRIVVFHSRDQTYSVSKALKTTCHAVEGLTW